MFVYPRGKALESVTRDEHGGLDEIRAFSDDKLRQDAA
jgi:hypothetical protein